MEFEILMNRLAPKLKGITRMLKRSFSFFDEDDLYQEAVLDIWSKYSEGALGDKTDSYVLQGAMYFLKNFIRTSCKKVDRNSIKIEEMSGDGDGNMLPAANDPDFAFLLVDLTINEIQSVLTPREEEIFLLTLEDLTTREIGARIGVSHAAVVKTEKKIRLKCAELFAEKINSGQGCQKTS